MPSLDAHQSSEFTKLVYIGDSGTGKTGSLVSLVRAGYNLKILDLDNGLDSLKAFILDQCPDRLSAVEFVTLKDSIRMGGGQPVVTPKAFVEGTKLMGKWEDESIPAEWGRETVFVLDSLSAYGRAAYAWAKGLNPTAKDPRQWYHAAQQGVEDVISLLTGEAFRTNVIVISHINYKEVVEGETKGYVNVVGTAMGPVIPRYFNTLIMAEKSVMGKTVKRTIKARPTTTVDLKAPIAPSKLPESPFDLNDGLGEIFELLRS
jgi:hypothetical protein